MPVTVKGTESSTGKGAVMGREMSWIVVSMIIGLAAPTQAAAAQASPWANGADWTEKSTAKFFYGAKNLLLGWTELITEPDEAIWEGSSVTNGILDGLWHSVGQTLGGAYHLLTFPLTNLDLPLPEGGVAWERVDPQ